MLKLTPDQVEAFNPEAEGWSSEVLIRLDEFPEIKDRPMVFQRDAYKRGDDRMVIEWDRGWTLRAIARNRYWFDGDITFDRLQELVREIVIAGQTAEEFLRELFEFELCAECLGDAEDHTASPDQFGKWHAWCTFKAPRMMHFVTTLNPALGNARPVRLEEVDSGKIVAEVTKSPAQRDYSRQRLTYGSAHDIPDESLKVAAMELLRNYREKKHNES